MYSQANVREESVLRPPTRALPSVIVDTEKVITGSGWVREAGRGKTAHGWTGVRPRVRLKERTGEPTRSPKITSAGTENIHLGTASTNSRRRSH